jgi:hypothetical protein
MSIVVKRIISKFFFLFTFDYKEKEGEEEERVMATQIEMPVYRL